MNTKETNQHILQGKSTKMTKKKCSMLLVHSGNRVVSGVPLLPGPPQQSLTEGLIFNIC